MEARAAAGRRNRDYDVKKSDQTVETFVFSLETLTCTRFIGSIVERLRFHIGFEYFHFVLASPLVNVLEQL